MSNKKETMRILQSELDNVVSEVMTERRKHPELIDQEWFDSLPSLPSLAKQRVNTYGDISHAE